MSVNRLLGSVTRKMSYHSSATFLENYSKMARQCNASATMRLVDPGSLHTVIKGGYPYPMYSPRAMVTPEGLLKLHDFLRALAFWGSHPDLPHSYLDLEGGDWLLFIVSIKLDVDSALYDTQLSKMPITVDTELAFVGSTSFKLNGLFSLPGVAAPLAKLQMQLVIVDTDTHKPKKFPTWWKEKYDKFSKPDEKSLILPRVELEPDCWKQTQRVNSSDLDPYCHISHCFYVRFYMNTYINWHVEKFGYYDNGDPFRNIKSMSQTLKGDARVGEEVEVQLRPRAGSEDIFDFVMLKNNQAINYCTLEFYPNITNNNISSKY